MSNTMIELARDAKSAIGMTILNRKCLMCKRNGTRLFLRHGPVKEYELCAMHAWQGISSVSPSSAAYFHQLVERDISPWMTAEVGVERAESGDECDCEHYRTLIDEIRLELSTADELAEDLTERLERQTLNNSRLVQVCEDRGKRIKQLETETGTERELKLHEVIDRLQAEREEARPLGDR